MALSKIDLNKCTVSELCTATPGLSDALANRIVSSRRRRQRFKSVDEVLQVRGITDDIFKNLCQHVKVANSKSTIKGKPNKTRKRNQRSPRTVLVIEPDTEHWASPSKSQKARTKRKDTPARTKRKDTPARPKSTGKSTRGKRKDTPARTKTQATRPKQSTRGTSTSKLPRPSTNSKQSTGRKSRLPKLKRSETKATSARKNVSHKPPTGKRVPVMKSRSNSPPTRSKNAPKPRSSPRSKSPARSRARSKSPISNRGKSTVIGGSSEERTTAHLKNCFVAVHSTPKGKLAPIVTVDINPTEVENAQSRERSRSPARHHSPQRAKSPYQVSGQRTTSPLRLSPIRSPRNTTLESGILNTRDTGISNEKENPLSVSESLDELLASSRNNRRGKENQSECSERVSQWLEESSKYNLTQSPLNKTVRSEKFALQQSYNSPTSQLEDTCKRSLELDFDEVSPVHQSLRKRSRLHDDACSCGVCYRCGKLKTPRRRRHRAAGSSQSLAVPSLPAWCNLL